MSDGEAEIVVLILIGVAAYLFLVKKPSGQATVTPGGGPLLPCCDANGNIVDAGGSIYCPAGSTVC